MVRENFKTMLSGAYKVLGFAKCSDRYLSARGNLFVNRRFDLANLIERLVLDVCRCAATPKRVIQKTR